MLTQNTIQDVFQTGKVQNSALAEEFHRVLSDKYKFQTVLSYYRQSDKQRVLELIIRCDSTSYDKLQHKKEIHYSDDSFSTEIINLLYELMEKHNIPYSEDKSFKLSSKDKLHNLFSKTKIIRSSVTLTSFDSLARWHILSLCLSEIKKLPCIKTHFCNIYDGWDQETNDQNHYFLFPSQKLLDEFLENRLNESIIPEILEIIAKYDKWGVITTENYKPRFILKSSLSPNKMFDLSRG